MKKFPTDNRSFEQKIYFLKKNANNCDLKYLSLFLELVKEERNRHLVQFPFEQIADETNIEKYQYYYEQSEDDNKKNTFESYFENNIKNDLSYYNDILKDNGIIGLYDYYVNLKLQFALSNIEHLIRFNNFFKGVKKRDFEYNNCYNNLNIEHDHHHHSKRVGFIEQFFIKVDEFACAAYCHEGEKYAPVVVSEECDSTTGNKVWEIYIGSCDDWSYTGYFKTKEDMEKCLLIIKHALPIFPIKELGDNHFSRFEFTN